MEEECQDLERLGHLRGFGRRVLSGLLAPGAEKDAQTFFIEVAAAFRDLAAAHHDQAEQCQQQRCRNQDLDLLAGVFVLVEQGMRQPLGGGKRILHRIMGQLPRGFAVPAFDQFLDLLVIEGANIEPGGGS